MPTTVSKPTKLKKVRSIGDLEVLAQDDSRYVELAIRAANNLGGGTRTLKEALYWLRVNAMETDEDGVVDEINFMLK